MTRTSPCSSGSGFLHNAHLQEDRLWTQGGATAKNNRALCVAPLHSLWWTRAQRRPPRSPVGYRIPPQTEPDTRCAVVNSYEPSEENVIPLPSHRNEEQAWKKVIFVLDLKRRVSFDLKQHIEVSGWNFKTFFGPLRTYKNNFNLLKHFERVLFAVSKTL